MQYWRRYSATHTHNVTIDYLHILQAQDHAKSHNSAATAVLFTRASMIALIDTHNFEAYTAWMASDDGNVAYENDPFDKL